MIWTICLHAVLISSGVVALPHFTEDNYLLAAAPCKPLDFQCMNGKCIASNLFCDSKNDCGDNSDEKYCNVDPLYRCPDGWNSCINRKRCIPSRWMCDGRTHCPGVSEQGVCAKKEELISWFLGQRKSGSKPGRWGSQVHRTAVALYLAKSSFFAPGNSTGEEIRCELTIQLTRFLAKDKTMSTQELALYIHALLVACIDPRDFYGTDLVRELRSRVEASGNFTNPFLILVLCNAGDTMTEKDIDRVTTAYDLKQRPYWTDYQAIASMALSCIHSRSDLFVDERILLDMLQTLKRNQFRNGTVNNYRTTAIVTQALFIHDSFKKDYDLHSAMHVILDNFKFSKSLPTAYYVLPVLYEKSLLNVSSSHCSKQPIGEDDALQNLLDINGETVIIQYSVWMGDDVNLARTWRLKVRVNSTIYDVLETVAKIDNRQRVEYNVVRNKPYVAALNGKEDDPELGMFWFVYLRPLNSDEDPKVVDGSPVDVKLTNNTEIILWYKRGPWNIQSSMKKYFLNSV